MIRNLNSRKHEGERECKVCRRIARLTDDKCQVCLALEKCQEVFCTKIILLSVSEPNKDALPLPENRYLAADTKESLLKRMESENYVRCYTKNEIYTGKHVTTKLWVGDYTTGDTFEKLARTGKRCGKNWNPSVRMWITLERLLFMDCRDRMEMTNM
ncbi:MAG: hypothetical protein ACLU9V_02890 [Roseburia sp.]